jgi:hypothetical protein
VPVELVKAIDGAAAVPLAKVWTPDTDIVPVTAHPVDVTTIFEVVPLPLVMP